MAVNLSPVGGVAAQFFDNSGNVLTGGKLLTYAAGTTTPAITYTTSAGNIPQPNPIILNAAGRVPGSGEIWLTDGISYKFVLTDSNDVLIATYDNIIGVNSNFVNFTNQQEIQTATAGQTVFNLTTTQYQPGTNSLSVFVDGVNQYGPGAQYAYIETDQDTVTFVNGLHVGAQVKFTTSQLNSSGVADAQQVSYIPPFTGAVATNVEAKLAQIINVLDFGAVGDGIADDTAAIQAAIDALPNDGGTVYFPAGRFKVTSTIEVGDGSNSAASAKNCIKLQGEGMGPYFGPSKGTEIFWDGTIGGGPVVRFNGSGDGFGLDRIEINANLKAATGMEIYSVRVSTFSNFAIREFTNAGLSLQIRTGPVGSVLFASGNTFSNWLITSSVAATYGIAIQGNFAANDDWHRNTFIGGVAQLPRASTGTNYATYLEFTDSNTWIECDLNVFGVGTGFGLFLNGANNSFYPENNFFYGCSIISTAVFESGGNVIGDNFFYNFATKDMEVIPSHPKLRGITDTGKMFGGFELLNEAITANLSSKGSFVNHILRNDNGNARWRVMNNANDSSSVGLEFAYSTDGITWTTTMALSPNGDVYVAMPGLGLRQIIASAPNTAGAGFRALSTTN